MKPYVLTGKKKLDLIDLSDVFRRSAADFSDRDKFAAEQIVELTRGIAMNASYYQSTEAAAINKSISASIKEKVEKICFLAHELNIKEVVLPFHDHPNSLFAKYIKEYVIEERKLPLKVTLRRFSFGKNNSSFGNIDESTRTVLDMGIRGITAATDKIKSTWDNSEKFPRRR